MPRRLALATTIAWERPTKKNYIAIRWLCFAVTAPEFPTAWMSKTGFVAHIITKMFIVPIAARTSQPV